MQEALTPVSKRVLFIYESNYSITFKQPLKVYTTIKVFKPVEAVSIISLLLHLNLLKMKICVLITCTRKWKQFHKNCPFAVTLQIENYYAFIFVPERRVIFVLWHVSHPSHSTVKDFVCSVFNDL
jgi:hypothetical protein